jgi:NAD(P)-dependent dehydrogenase (short-subunit alcohol dehydrogenase family)
MGVGVTEQDIAVVTGGARGIGQGIALALASSGVDVAILDAAPADVATLPYPLSTTDDVADTLRQIEQVGVRSMAVTADVRDRRAVESAVQSVERVLGPITMVVTAAGVCSVANAGRMSDEAWDDVVDTNLHGTYNTTRVTVPLMVERGRGRVLCIVGDEARRGAAGISHVAAASWAVVGLAKSIALETAVAGVAVNVLSIGPVQTTMTASAMVRQNLTRGGESPDADEALAARHPNGEAWVAMDDLTAAARFLLGAPSTSMTGSVLDISNGQSALNTS